MFYYTNCKIVEKDSIIEIIFSVRISLTIFLFLISLILKAQQSTYFHVVDLGDEYKNFLSLCVYQSSDGYLWIGTKTGLLQYDGYQVKKFTSGQSNTGLSNNEVHCIYEDTNNNLWLGTKDGLNKLDSQQRRITHFLTRKQLNNNILTCINHISEDSLGNLWLSLRTGGVIVFSPAGKKIKQIDHILVKGKKIATGSIYKTHIFDDKIIVASQKGLLQFIPEKNIFQPVHPENNILNQAIQSMDAKKDTLLVVTKDGVLVLLNKHLQILKIHKTNIPNEFKFSVGFHNQSIWLGTFRRGLYKFSLPAFESERCLPGNSPFSIPHSTVRGFHSINKHQLWLATDNGICKVDDYRFKFDLHNFQRIESDEVLCIKNINNQIYAGTKNGLFRYPDKKILAKTDIHDILLSNSGKIYLVAAQQGVLITNNFKNFDTLHIPDFFPRQIIEDSNSFWVGGKEGLIKIHKKTAKHEKINFYTSFVVSSLLKQNDSILWVGTWTKGLFRLNTFTQDYRHYHNESYNSRGLSWGFINCLHIDKKGQLYAGTLTGLNLYQATIDSFTTLHLKPGLFNDRFYDILPAKNPNSLWMSTNYGIAKYHIPTQSFLYFNRKNGLPELNFVNKATTKNYPTRLFFATKKGILHFCPHSLLINPNPPELHAFLIRGGKRTKIHHNSVIEIDYFDKAFSIEMLGIEHSLPGRNYYKFSMHKNSPRFHFMADERQIKFDTLTPGNYHFMFTASNSDQTWNKDVFKCQIQIKKAWYQRFDFIIFILVLFIGIVFLGLYFVKLNRRKSQSPDLPQVPKYAKSRIDKKELDNYVNRLNCLMEKEKPFLKENVHLNDIAQQLDIHPNYLSQAINRVLEMNFFEYINKQRVEQAKKMLKDKKYEHLNIFGIALESGFSSKSTFYSVFKKYTGTTPAKYRQNAKNN